MGGSNQRFVLKPQDAAAFEDIFAGKVMKLGGTYCALKFRRTDHFAEELIGFEQNVVLKEDVVDSNNALFPQNPIVQIVLPAPHLEANAKVGIVVEVRAGG